MTPQKEKLVSNWCQNRKNHNFKRNKILRTIDFKGFAKKWLNENLEAINQTNDPFSQKVVRRQEFIVFPKLIKNLILIFVFLACLLYLGFYFKKIIFFIKTFDFFYYFVNIKIFA